MGREGGAGTGRLCNQHVVRLVCLETGCGAGPQRSAALTHLPGGSSASSWSFFVGFASR